MAAEKHKWLASAVRAWWLAVAALLCAAVLCLVPQNAYAAGSIPWDKALGVNLNRFISNVDAHLETYLDTPYSMSNRMGGPGKGMDCSSFWSFLVLREGPVSSSFMDANTGSWMGMHTTYSLVYWAQNNNIKYDTGTISDLTSGKIKLAKGDFVIATNASSWTDYNAMMYSGSHVSFYWGTNTSYPNQHYPMWLETTSPSGTRVFASATPIGGNKIFVVRGSGAPSRVLTSWSQGAWWRRESGSTALDTMSQIVSGSWSKNSAKRATAAVLATKDNFPDALAASSLAGRFNAPVLMTGPSSLSSQARKAISDLGVSKVYVCGGKRAVSDAVLTQLRNMKVEVKRVSGAAADDTAVEIAKELGGSHARTCFVTTEANFADALSAAPYAYAKGAPVFLTRQRGTALSADTLQAIKSGGYTKVIVVGGKFAVSEGVVDQLRSVCGTVDRIGGNTAVDTSIKLADWEKANGLSYWYCGFSTDKNFPDALAGAAACGYKGGVLLLVNKAEANKVVKVVRDNRGSLYNGVIYGGMRAVPYSVLQKLQAATYYNTASNASVYSAPGETYEAGGSGDTGSESRVLQL